MDRATLIIGSMNLDPRSRRLNTEVALRIESPSLGAQLGTLFDEAIAHGQVVRVQLAEAGNPAAPLVWLGEEEGRPVHLEDEPLASWWRHFVSGLLGALAPEELL